jgi:hypothetical protein
MSAEQKKLPSQHCIYLHWMQTVSGSKASAEPLYVLLTPHILTEELLCSNGFPRPHPEEKGVAVLHLPPGTARRTPLSPDRKRVLRVCCRCNQGYSVNKNGFQVKEEQCIYHWGRLFQTRGRFRISGVLNFGHHLGLKTRTQPFRNWICFHPQVKEGRCLLGWVP